MVKSMGSCWRVRALLWQLSLCLLWAAAGRVQASGIVLHIYMSDLAVSQLRSPALKALLLSQRDAYRNGAFFADAGYLPPARFGEFAHWSAFLTASYEQLADGHCALTTESLARELSPACAKAWAHFFGMVAHSQGDVNFDRFFVTAVAREQFAGDIDKAQNYTDRKLDWYALIEQQALPKLPRRFVPYGHVLEAFAAAGFSTSYGEVHRSTALQYWMVLKGLKITAPIVYPRLQREASWAARHYLTAPGGVFDTAHTIALLWDRIWDKISANEPVAFYEKGGWPMMEFGVR